MLNQFLQINAQWDPAQAQVCNNKKKNATADQSLHDPCVRKDPMKLAQVSLKQQVGL